MDRRAIANKGQKKRTALSSECSQREITNKDSVTLQGISLIQPGASHYFIFQFSFPLSSCALTYESLFLSDPSALHPRQAAYFDADAAFRWPGSFQNSRHSWIFVFEAPEIEKLLWAARLSRPGHVGLADVRNDSYLTVSAALREMAIYVASIGFRPFVASSAEAILATGVFCTDDSCRPGHGPVGSGACVLAMRARRSASDCMSLKLRPK